MAVNKYAKMEIKRGDIFWVRGNANSTGSEQDFTRPCVIVSNDMANFYSPVVLVVPMTTRKKNIMPTHAVVTMGENKSIALCEQVTAISVKRIINYIDYVRPKEMRAIDNGLKVALFLQGGETDGKDTAGNIEEVAHENCCDEFGV